MYFNNLNKGDVIHSFVGPLGTPIHAADLKNQTIQLAVGEKTPKMRVIQLVVA